MSDISQVTFVRGIRMGKKVKMEMYQYEYDINSTFGGEIITEDFCYDFLIHGPINVVGEAEGAISFKSINIDEVSLTKRKPGRGSSGVSSVMDETLSEVKSAYNNIIKTYELSDKVEFCIMVPEIEDVDTYVAVI